MNLVIGVILETIGIIALIPSFFLIPVLIITAIIGAVKKDYKYLKIYLKIWAYSLLVIVGVMILYAIVSFVAAIFGSGV